jgi:hypothetical protein
MLVALLLVVLRVGVAVLVGEVLLRVLVMARHYYRFRNVGRYVQVLVALVYLLALAQHTYTRAILDTRLRGVETLLSPPRIS